MIFNKKKYPNCYKAFKYADDILEGRIVSCWQVFAACERFKRDLTNPKFYFDFDKAERVCRLVQKFPHIKGPLAGKPLLLEPWQLFIHANVFGFHLKTTETRRFTKVFILCARKNGKTALSSPLGLYMLSLDGEDGSEVYSLASKKDQARIVFDTSREQLKRSKTFAKKTGTQLFRHHIENDRTAGKYCPLASDSNSLDGLGPSCVIFDEVHSFKDRNLYGVMETAVGARTQPLLWAISTAGFDDTGICYELQIDLEKVLKREYEDDSQFGMIYQIDKEDDFRDQNCWVKANPNLGVSLSKEYIQQQVDKAIRQPGNKNNVLTKHFNIWCTASENLFDMIAYDKCKDVSLRREDFKTEPCYVGVDLASKIDLTGFVYIFKKDEIFQMFSDAFLPEAAIEGSNNASYPAWVDQGHLISTKGEAINYTKLEDYFIKETDNFKPRDTFYDPWSATQFAQNMSTKGLEMTEFKMNTGNVSEPLKYLDAVIREGKLRHNGCPVLRWCFSNVVAKEDHNSNIYFRKAHPKFKIDLAVAATMAIAGWIQEQEKESVYESRGIIVL